MRTLSPDPNDEPLARAGLPLPEFTRFAWVSDNARSVWEPRLARIRKAWSEIEWQSVAQGVRACAIVRLAPEALVERAGEWAEHGLATLPFALNAAGEEPYRNVAARPEFGAPFKFRAVIGSLENVVNFKRAINAADDDRIGELLGYPACCREFFRRIWLVEGLRDTSWPMAMQSAAQGSDAALINVEGSDLANILWRWMGIRAVPHLPCSFACEQTVRLANRLVEIGRGLGFQAEMTWLKDILSWPVEWSALHGIAEIKTPILRILTQTDVVHEKRTIRRQGTSYPQEGMSGVRFPYRQPIKPKLTGSKAFKQGLREVGRSSPLDEWYATDNGFATVAAMNQAHAPIVRLAGQTLQRQTGNIIDLGCGNGALLKNICVHGRDLIPYGIDKDPARIAHARELLPAFKDNFQAGDLFDERWLEASSRRYVLAIFMPGRMLEVDPKRARRLQSWLGQHCDEILLYCYADWSERSENLSALARIAGFKLKEADDGMTAALARVAACDRLE